MKEKVKLYLIKMNKLFFTTKRVRVPAHSAFLH